MRGLKAMGMGMMQVGYIVHGRKIAAAITVIVGMGGSPKRPSSGALILLIVTMQRSTTGTPQPLVGGHPRTIVRETAIVTPTPYEGLMMVGVLVATPSDSSPLAYKRCQHLVRRA